MATSLGLDRELAACLFASAKFETSEKITAAISLCGNSLLGLKVTLTSPSEFSPCQ